MAEKSWIKPQKTEAETDAALARAYALLVWAGERAVQAGLQNHDGDGEYRDGRRIRDEENSRT